MFKKYYFPHIFEEPQQSSQVYFLISHGEAQGKQLPADKVLRFVESRLSSPLSIVESKEVDFNIFGFLKRQKKNP